MRTDDMQEKSHPVGNCPECDGTKLSTSYEIETIPYGSGDKLVNLSCRVPVRKCGSCGFTFTDDEAADIRHEAVCRYLNVLTPTEIVAIRKHYNLSRSEFSKLTHIGEASLARWENGYLIQNAANDQLLFLLRYPENAERLRIREARAFNGERLEEANEPISPLSKTYVNAEHQFRALTPSETEKRLNDAKSFSLRPVLVAA